MKARAFMVMGLPGTGKTYLASKLAEAMGAVHLSSDRIRRQLFDQRDYTPEEKAAVYTEMARQMGQALEQGDPVVLDATFYSAALRQRFLDLAEANGLSLGLVQTFASEATLKERLSRKRPESEADFSVYVAIKEIFEAPIQEVCQVWTDRGNLDQLVQQLLEDGKI